MPSPSAIMWIITKDLIGPPTRDDTHRMVICGIPAAKSVANEMANSPLLDEHMPCQFKIYDDDGVLYYEGRASCSTFDPLDDFAKPNAGATSIKYKDRRSNVWVEL